MLMIRFYFAHTSPSHMTRKRSICRLNRLFFARISSDCRHANHHSERARHESNNVINYNLLKRIKINCTMKHAEHTLHAYAKHCQWNCIKGRRQQKNDQNCHCHHHKINSCAQTLQRQIQSSWHGFCHTYDIHKLPAKWANLICATW